jgi:hypothetical protein
LKESVPRCYRNDKVINRKCYTPIPPYGYMQFERIPVGRYFKTLSYNKE